MKRYPETHQHGVLYIETACDQGFKECNFGIQIARDGRIWICLDGIAFLRFKPSSFFRIQDEEVTP